MTSAYFPGMQVLPYQEPEATEVQNKIAEVTQFGKLRVRLREKITIPALIVPSNQTTRRLEEANATTLDQSSVSVSVASS